MTYIEKDIQFSVLTSNLLVLGWIPIITNEDPTDNGNNDLRKRQKYAQRCIEAAWKR